MTTKETRTCSTTHMIGYASGDVANSLIMNSFSAFIMLFYTKALGISPIWAGIIMASSTFWDAVSDPIMGYITDNTRSKYGRRHPYMLFGGVLMVVAYFCFWAVPSPFMVNQALMIGYLIVVNLLFRTAYTVFVVPYGALGFEICQDYTGRTKLQSIKTIVIMLANILGPAMAWTLFFPEVDGAPRAASVPSNYFWMGTVFSAVSLVAIFFMLFYTRKEMRDSRNMNMGDVSVKDFFVDMKEIITDRFFIWVFLYGFAILIGIVLVASFQMYVYEDFMKLEPVQKTFTHGGTMAGMMVGAFFASGFAKRYDKKGTVYIGGFTSVVAGVLLAALFLSGILKPGPIVSVVVFALMNSLYWFGIGVMMPVATSMIADISEINEINTGINKDGAYSAVYSFTSKLSQSLALFLTGLCLTWIGYVDGIDVVQSPEVVMRLLLFAFLVGPLLALFALAIIKLYPVSEGMLKEMRAAKNAE